MTASSVQWHEKGPRGTRGVLEKGKVGLQPPTDKGGEDAWAVWDGIELDNLFFNAFAFLFSNIPKATDTLGCSSDACLAGMEPWSNPKH